MQVERLINREKVVAMVGVWPTQTPTAAMSERNQTPCIDALGIAETWNRGYRWVFKNYSTGQDEADQEFAALEEQCKLNGVPMPKTVYMMYISDDCSTASAAGFRVDCQEVRQSRSSATRLLNQASRRSARSWTASRR